MTAMEDMGKIAALAVVAALCAAVVRKQAPEIALVLALVGAALIVSRSLVALTGVRTMLEQLREAAGLAPAVAAPVIKTVGVAILTRLAAELCRDAKESGLAAFVETAGAAAALFLALPLIHTVLDLLEGLL